MKTINSLSGGRSSCYMAYHYPADYEIFALVTIEDPTCSPKDPGVVKKVSDKIGREFIATVEDDKTLKVLLDLEQKIGRKITWVVGNTFESINKKASICPNRVRRFCTSEMKLRPIWDWWYKNIGEKIRMGIGYRYDEKERAEKFTTTFKGIVGKRGSRNKWEEIEWREGYFPMIENGIFQYHVRNWADTSGLDFPEDSNCVGCFHKSEQQLRKNFDVNPEKMEWFVKQEKVLNSKFKENITYNQIKNIGLQADFLFGEGSTCQSGFCTD